MRSSFPSSFISCISIHASTRGATMTYMVRQRQFKISIHASTRGATKKRLKIACKGFNFNPRFHERSDRLFNVPYSSDHISIHASTRGATEKGELENILGVFQSTLPREERRRLTYPQFEITYFNPRFHERSDATRLYHWMQFKISIHASTRGATIYLHKL